MRNRIRAAMAFGIVLVMALVAQAALAAPTAVDTLELTGDLATWDVTNNYDYGTSGAPCMSNVGGFTPAEDGDFDSQSDAFDGGLYLHVRGRLFNDADGIGNYNAGDQQLKMGTNTVQRLRVTRTDRALQDSPTLRTLVRLSNPTGRDIAAPITWDSAMGADDDEGTRGSNAGNALVTTPKDDWIVASDDAATPSDPPVTFAVYGRGAIRVKQRAVPWAPEDPDPGDDSSEGCVVFKFRVKVPAGTSRYVLFFTEMHETNEDAIDAADRFSRLNGSRPLMDGVSNGVMKRVLNWNLP